MPMTNDRTGRNSQAKKLVRTLRRSLKASDETASANILASGFLHEDGLEVGPDPARLEDVDAA